jgi:hypothetical protein
MVEDLFEHDYDLETDYHSILNGKWVQCVDTPYYVEII